MAKTIAQLNVNECIGGESLILEMRKNFNTGKTLCIIGDAGVGKTDLMNRVAKIEGFDKFFEVRMAGVASEDILGLPIKIMNTETGKEEVQFVKLDWMQYIKNHPEQKILLLLDELNRASTEVESGLFNILEGKIDGQYYPNLQVVACINHGFAYTTNIEFEDIAFRRRVTFIKYTPDKRDAIAFIKENNYHPDLVLACEDRGINMTNYAFKGDEEYIYEQPTTYGSFFSFNRRLLNCARIIGLAKNIGNYYNDQREIIEASVVSPILADYDAKMAKAEAKVREELKGKRSTTVDKAIEEAVGKIKAVMPKYTLIDETNFHWTLPTHEVLTELKTSSSQYFNEVVGQLLITKISDINSLRDIDVVAQVIKKGTIPEDFMRFKEDILLRCKSEIIKDPMLLSKYAKKIIDLYSSRFEYIPMMFDQITNTLHRGDYGDKMTFKDYDKIIEEFALKHLTDEQFEELGAIIDQNNEEDMF